MQRITLASLLFGLLLVSGHAAAISITFVRVADSDTLIPGTTDTFDVVGDPSLDGGNVAFHSDQGAGTDQRIATDA